MGFCKLTCEFIFPMQKSLVDWLVLCVIICISSLHHHMRLLLGSNAASRLLTAAIFAALRRAAPRGKNGGDVNNGILSMTCVGVIFARDYQNLFIL